MANNINPVVIPTEEVPVIIPKVNEVAPQQLLPPGQQGNTAIDGHGSAEASDLAAAPDTSNPLKKKRLCRFPGCSRVIKSQGHCQRHGAKAKRCKVAGCDKQAQGTHDGMCKRHWKAVNFPNADVAKEPEAVPPPPEGISVYDSVLPQSISYRPGMLYKNQLEQSNKNTFSENPTSPPEEVNVMPLVLFFREGANKNPGWHRNAERRARGMFPVTSLSTQLEPWERQLALVEILLLSGGTPFANFKDLAHAWGREKGFHAVVASSVCERRGEVDRKRRSDAGKTLTSDQREAMKKKRKTRPVEGPPGVDNSECVPIAASIPPAQPEIMEQDADKKVHGVAV